MSEPRTATLEVPGAILRYDIRAAETETAEPPLLMIASPMDASGFGWMSRGSSFAAGRSRRSHTPRCAAASATTSC
jgi:hypothetical protein